MYKIIKQNDSRYVKGEQVKDLEYNLEARRLLAEGARPAFASYHPNFTWGIVNMKTGFGTASKTKYNTAEAALLGAVKSAVHELHYTQWNREDNINILVSADDIDFLSIDMRYVPYPL